GYRFLAPVTVTPIADPCAPGPRLPCEPAPVLVEREAVLRQLSRALTQAQQGRRHIVFITGEPGIGKTAVVETFLAEATPHTPVGVAHGQCIESYGTVEASLPILEALGALCRGPDGTRLVALLRRQAPTWVAQMPWLLTAPHQAQLPAALQGATQA